MVEFIEAVEKNPNGAMILILGILVTGVCLVHIARALRGN